MVRKENTSKNIIVPSHSEQSREEAAENRALEGRNRAGRVGSRGD
jgi:hypothetical protein